MPGRTGTLILTSFRISNLSTFDYGCLCVRMPKFELSAPATKRQLKRANGKAAAGAPLEFRCLSNTIDKRDSRENRLRWSKTGFLMYTVCIHRDDRFSHKSFNNYCKLTTPPPHHLANKPIIFTYHHRITFILMIFSTI